MANLDSFQQFLVGGVAEISIGYLIIALLVAAILSFILGKIYIKYGRALSNRRIFAGNFVLLATTTTLIITVVKSSLALSLGLVGALSIVRFRAAIKEPEELAFLFLTIAIGLGLGAGQLKTTVVAFIIISLFIFIRGYAYNKEDNQNLYLTISGKNISLEKIVEVIKKYSLAVTLKRFDSLPEGVLEASFYIELKSFMHLEKLKKEIESLSKSINITYLDKSGM